ncbi:MAG TPA: FecR family protein [Blastocatellia bacterium]|nr:FecR family protein [Blastocatellia bacterium]
MNRILPASVSLPSKLVWFSLLVLVAAGVCRQPASAQYLASTKAGFVNRVEGKVLIQRAGNELNNAGRASLGTQMKEGDQLITTADSRAEVLLSPGSYLRLDGSTKLRAVGTRFSAMRFELLAGSVIAEVSAEENTNIKQENPLEVVTPHGSVAITKTGVYRLDVRDTYTSVSTHKGELYLGTRDQAVAKTALKVSKDKVARLTGSAATPEIAKLDRYNTDDFEEWSFQRAETLVAAHRSVLSRSSSLGTLASGWIFDPFYNCYTFVPFGRRFTTAYGFGFYSSYGSCGCGNYGYWYPYYGSGPYNTVGTTAGSSINPSLTPRVRGDSDRHTTVAREVNVGRRVDVAPPSFSRGTDSRFPDAASHSMDSRSWGPSVSSGGGDRSISAPSVSPGRVDTGRSVDSGGSSGGRGGGRGVNP